MSKAHPFWPDHESSTHRVAPGFTPSISQESLLLRMRRMVSACSLVKPALTSVTGRLPPFSHMSVMDEKKDWRTRRHVHFMCWACVCVYECVWLQPEIILQTQTHLKHFIDALPALRRGFKVMEAPGLRPQTSLPLVDNTPLCQIHLWRHVAGRLFESDCTDEADIANTPRTRLASAGSTLFLTHHLISLCLRQISSTRMTLLAHTMNTILSILAWEPISCFISPSQLSRASKLSLRPTS